jgi:nucleotide-binding universal stress UspA family protein
VAFCTFHNVALTNDTPLSTTHTLNRPPNMLANSIEFLIFSNGTSQAVTAGLESFTELYSSGGLSRCIYYRISDGTEGATPTAVLTTGAVTGRLCSVAFEVRGWAGSSLATDVVLATTIVYTGTAPSPFAFPTATATWGVEENSFLAVYQCDGINTVLSLPAGYVEIGTAMAAVSTSAGVTVSYSNVAAASETPPRITMASQRNANANTIVIRSAGGTSVSSLTLSDATVYNGQTDVTITGSGFGASQGAGLVKISPTDNVNDASAVTQTVTAWSANSVTITAVRGTLAVSTPMYLFLTNNSAASNSAGAAVQIVYDPIRMRWTT